MSESRAEQTVRIVKALAKVARPLILTHFSKDSCIASTRIGIDALAYFDVKSVPIPLLAMFANAEAAAMIAQGATLEEVREATLQRTVEEAGGPWTLGVGAGEGSGWSGHLVIGLPQILTIVDLSADQASRPHKGISINKPLMLPIPDIGWWRGGEDAMATFQDEESQMVMILDRNGTKDPQGYLQSPNWRRVTGGSSRPFKTITGQIIRAMKQELEGA